MNEDCKHEEKYMRPMIEHYENKFGRIKSRGIWHCEHCGKHSEPRPYHEIYYSESKNTKHVDIANDDRVLIILSQQKGITYKAALALLLEHKIDNPLELGGEYFWTE